MVCVSVAVNTNHLPRSGPRRCAPMVRGGEVVVVVVVLLRSSMGPDDRLAVGQQQG